MTNPFSTNSLINEFEFPLTKGGSGSGRYPKGTHQEGTPVWSAEEARERLAGQLAEVGFHPNREMFDFPLADGSTYREIDHPSDADRWISLNSDNLNKVGSAVVSEMGGTFEALMGKYDNDLDFNESAGIAQKAANAFRDQAELVGEFAGNTADDAGNTGGWDCMTTYLETADKLDEAAQLCRDWANGKQDGQTQSKLEDAFADAGRLIRTSVALTDFVGNAVTGWNYKNSRLFR